MRKIDPEISNFKMERDGQFLAKWTNEATKCGPASAQPIYQYKCVLVCAPSLDENGFIIDNLQIHDYFVKTYGKALPAVSCERMAAHAVKTIKRMCQKDGLAIEQVSVSISGMPGAWLTAEWRK